MYWTADKNDDSQSFMQLCMRWFVTHQSGADVASLASFVSQSEPSQHVHTTHGTVNCSSDSAVRDPKVGGIGAATFLHMCTIVGQLEDEVGCVGQHAGNEPVEQG